MAAECFKTGSRAFCSEAQMRSRYSREQLACVSYACDGTGKEYGRDGRNCVDLSDQVLVSWGEDERHVCCMQEVVSQE